MYSVKYRLTVNIQYAILKMKSKQKGKHSMKKIISILLAGLMALSLCSCKSNTDSSSSASEPVKVKNEDSNFDKYISNTAIATGNNYIVENADKAVYRAYFPVEEYGNLEYCFYFSNTVDSTYDSGTIAHVGQSGGKYTIESAYIADGGSGPDDEIKNKTEVTFNGKKTKNVSENEVFWSDSIEFNVEEGHYLVWEWTLTGTNIPCIYMSTLTSTTADLYGEGTFSYCDQIPLPQMIGAKRDVKHNIAAIGDSITQGCQTEFMKYEFWAARISSLLGDDYGFYNCGLGWSRASDAAKDGNWLERAKSAETVIVAFGTNDIISGEYNSETGSTAEEIDTYLRSILDVLKKAGCRIIVFNAPPQDYTEELENIRLKYNELCKKTCDEYGSEYFDFASYLSSASEPSKPLYGAHPNGEGGKIVAEAFVEKYKAILN